MRTAVTHTVSAVCSLSFDSHSRIFLDSLSDMFTPPTAFKVFFFFKVFQMWKKKGGGLGDTNREEQQKKKNWGKHLSAAAKAGFKAVRLSYRRVALQHVIFILIAVGGCVTAVWLLPAK